MFTIIPKYLQFNVFRLLEHAKGRKVLERDWGGSGMQSGDDNIRLLLCGHSEKHKHIGLKNVFSIFPQYKNESLIRRYGCLVLSN